MPEADGRAFVFLPCAAGVEAFLGEEAHRIVAQAGVSGVEWEPVRGGVGLRAPAPGAARLVLALNLESRLAQRVLWRVAVGEYRDEHGVHELARGVRWHEWIAPDQSLRVDTTSRRSPLRSLRFAALRVKDAVCDRMRERTGSRPDVSLDAPDLPLLLHLEEQVAALYVDTSGDALFKRGWRTQTGDAPLKETLAAALLAAAGWTGCAGDPLLLDPCCGAGTIAIEAAQMACGIAPGGRRRFAFERLGPFRGMGRDWREMGAAARARVHAPTAEVFASDMARRMVEQARHNAGRAGVGEAIAFSVADALVRTAPADTGVLVLNPPYGARMAPRGPRGGATGRASSASPEPSADAGEPGGDATTAAFVAGLAAHWKRAYAGWTAWVLSPDPRLPTAMRLEARRRVPLWNGPIECRLFRFDMVAGSNRRRPAPAPGEPRETPEGGSG